MTARMRTRNRQPLGPLPLTEKAAWVFLPTVPVELVTGTPVTYGSAGATYSSDEGGRALDTTASADGSRYAEIAHSSRLQIPSGAAVFVLRVKLTANLGARISKTTGNGGSDSEFDFVAYEYLGAGVLTLGLTRVGGGGSRGWGVLESAYRPPANKWVTLAAYAPPLVDSPSVFFADGVRLSVSDLGGTGTGSPDTTTQPIRFNKRDDLSTSNDQSKIAIAYAIPGGNEAMAERLSRNPWQLFAPQRTARIYSFPTAGGAAALEGSLAASATVSAALTSAIRPAASVAASATVAAALSTSIRPAASVAASATVTAALTTAIRFASSVSASASIAGDISGAAAFASTLSASAIVTGALSTAIRLNASVIGAATVAGVLAEPGAAAALEAAIYGYATVSANLTGGTSTIWTPASASSGTWTPASAAGGTWVAQ